jgi:hypothetical protein
MHCGIESCPRLKFRPLKTELYERNGTYLCGLHLWLDLVYLKRMLESC